MILRFPRPSVPARVALQRAGYFSFRDPRSGQESYIRRLGTQFYPRFHLYAEESPTTLILKLHLDQKQPSYTGVTKHSGEYDGPVVETEARRIQNVLGTL